MHLFLRSVPAVALSLLTEAVAQDGAAQAQRVRAALDKMSKLSAVAFKTTESQDSAMMRSMPTGMGGQETEVAGRLAQGVLQAKVDDDEVLLYRGRQVARTDAGWKLRARSLANGAPLPFVFDPQAFAEVLNTLPDEALVVAHQETGDFRGKPVVIYSLTLSGTHARELNLTGVTPRVRGMPIFTLGGNRSIGGDDPPETKMDIALFVEPETNLVHRVRVKSYEESNLPDNVIVRVAGPGGEEQELGGEEEGAAEAAAKPEAAGATVFQKGLPKRKLGKKTSVMEFDAALSEHGEAKAPALDDEAKRLLKLEAAAR
jgi:hypothetical protein